MKSPTNSTISRLNRLGKQKGDYLAALSNLWLPIRQFEDCTEYRHSYTGLVINYWHGMVDDRNGFDDQITYDEEA